MPLDSILISCYIDLMSDRIVFTLRLPKDVHAALKLQSEREGNSINFIINQAIQVHPRFYLYLDIIEKNKEKCNYCDEPVSRIITTEDGEEGVCKKHYTDLTEV